jgi:tetratricopeptide (TPR) repeat protein
MNFIKTQFNKKTALTAIILTSTLLLSACGEPTEPKKAPLSQYTQQGNTYLDQFQFKAAIASAQNAIAAYPEKIDGYLVLAKIYLQLAQPEASSFILKKYKNSKNTEYYFLLLESYQKDNKLISANNLIGKHQAILQQQPNRLKKEQAKILLRETDTGTALALFKELESIEKYKADALIGQARVSALSNDFQGAIKLLDRATNSDAKNSEALIFKSYLLINENNLIEAEKTLSLALTILPSSDLFTPERINVLQALGEVLTSQGRSSEALLYSRILADEFPEAASINQNYAEASKQYQNKEFGLAKQTLEKILKVAPSHKKSLTLYGVILYAQGDMEGAQKYLNGLIDPEKDSDKLTQLYAITQLKLDNAVNVLSMLENTITTETSYETLTLYLLAAIDQQQLDKSKFALSRIEKLFPNSDKSALLSANYYSKVEPIDHQKALEILQQALKNTPDNIHLQTAYLKKLLFLKQDNVATKYIQQLQITKNSSVETQLLVAKYKLYRKQYQQAEKLFNAVLAQQENNLTALYGLAQSKQQTENWVEAQNAYRNIILFHPEELKGYQGFIFSQIKRGEEVKAGINRLPENHDANILALVLADLELQKNNIKQAKIHIDVASREITNNLLPYLSTLEQKINYRLAVIALADKKFNEARKITLVTLQKTPEQPDLLLLLAKIEINSGQLNEAQKVIQQLEEMLPENPVISIYQADIASAQNNTDKAIAILENSWKKNSDEKVAQKLYITLQTINKEKAMQFLTQWQKKSPESIAMTVNQAFSLQERGLNQEALELYEKVLKQKPEELTSLNNAAWLYSSLNNNRGEVLAQKAFSLAPQNAAIIDTYGWILYKAGKIEKAKLLIQQALKLAPNNAEITKHWLEIKDL